MNKMISAASVVACVLVPFFATAQEYFVDTNGNDAAEGSAAKPWRTIGRAAKGEKVVVTGADPVRGWTKRPDGLWEKLVAYDTFGGLNPFTDSSREGGLNARGATISARGSSRTDGRCRLHHSGTFGIWLDPGLKRAIAMVSRGNGQLIVWNPGPDSAERVEDFGENGWNRFVCVEPATIPPGKPLELAPGEEHKLVMAIQSVPEGTQN